jgi:S-adenosyl methyltransferase
MSRNDPVSDGDPEGSASWERTAPDIDVSRPHAARMYDYYLGGKDHFEADRVTAEKALRSWAAVRTGMWENRAFLGRAVRYLVEEAGIRHRMRCPTRPRSSETRPPSSRARLGCLCTRDALR